MNRVLHEPPEAALTAIVDRGSGPQVLPENVHRVLVQHMVFAQQRYALRDGLCDESPWTGRPFGSAHMIRAPYAAAFAGTDSVP